LDVPCFLHGALKANFQLKIQKQLKKNPTKAIGLSKNCIQSKQTKTAPSKTTPM
jgi:hypothetical protein